jgi:hypothetical protein
MKHKLIRHCLTVLTASAALLCAVCADARPIDHRIHHLRNEIIALNASLITFISQAETRIGNDVEVLHASIIAAQLETVDTAAAYLEAKSLIDDLDTLRQRAIADLTLPSDYAPPDVAFTALAGASTDPVSVLASTHEDFDFTFGQMSAIVGKATLDIQKKLETLAQNRENIDVVEMFKMQMMMNHLSQLSEMSSSVMSSANSSIASMARNVKG